MKLIVFYNRKHCDTLNYFTPLNLELTVARQFKYHLQENFVHFSASES